MYSGQFSFEPSEKIIKTNQHQIIESVAIDISLVLEAIFYIRTEESHSSWIQ